jgi:hypothetical protein
MSSILNFLNALQPGNNTGVEVPALDIKNTVGVYLLPVGYKFPANALATQISFAAALAAAVIAPLGTRIFPVFGLIPLADGTEATTIQTFPNGFKFPVRKGYLDLTYQFVKGGIFLYHALVNGFDMQPVDILIVDAAGTGWGVANSDGSLSGLSADYIEFPTMKINDGAKATEYALHFSAEPTQLASFGYVKLPLSKWKAAQGLKNVTLSGNANPDRAAAISRLRGVIGSGGTSLHATFGASLAVANLWVATDAVSGNNLTVATAAEDVNADGYTLTVDTNDSDYNAAHAVVWQLATPTVLATANVPGIESNTYQTLA